MPPVSHPFKKGAMVVLMNYSDHAPPHVHVKYQGDVGEYRDKNENLDEAGQGSAADVAETG